MRSNGPPGPARARARWRPRVRLMGLFSGALLGLGVAILLQQYGYRVMTRGFLIQAVVSGVLTGLVLPSLRYALAVRKFNRALGRAGATA